MNYVENIPKDVAKYYRSKGLRGFKRLVAELPARSESTWPEPLLIAHALRSRETETNPRHAWDIEYLALTTPWEDMFWEALDCNDSDTARVCLDHCGEDRPSHIRVAVGRLFG